jgi:hypothetical protein
VRARAGVRVQARTDTRAARGAPLRASHTAAAAHHVIAAGCCSRLNWSHTSKFACAAHTGVAPFFRAHTCAPANACCQCAVSCRKSMNTAMQHACCQRPVSALSARLTQRESIESHSSSTVRTAGDMHWSASAVTEPRHIRRSCQQLCVCSHARHASSSAYSAQAEQQLARLGRVTHSTEEPQQRSQLRNTKTHVASLAAPRTGGKAAPQRSATRLTAHQPHAPPPKQ